MASQKHDGQSMAVSQLQRAAAEHLLDSVRGYAVFMLDTEGRVATWNAGAQRIKGYAAHEIIGQHFSRFYPAGPDVLALCARMLREAAQAGRVEHDGFRVRQDGSQFWGNVVISAVRDDQAALLGFAKVTHDLSERRKAEETERELLRERALSQQLAARQRERGVRLEMVLEGVAEGITAQDASGRLVFANDAAARICGFESADAFMNAPAAEVFARFELLDETGQAFSPEDLPGRRALQGLPAPDTVFNTRDKITGRQWWSLVSAKPMRCVGSRRRARSSAHRSTFSWR
jgi:PAS domain S-box-containing protein